MAENDRGEALRRAVEAFVLGDVDALRELFTDDVSGWSPILLVSSLDELAERIADREEALSDVAVEIDAPRCLREQGFAEYRLSAVFSGPLVLDDDVVVEPNGRRVLLGAVTAADFTGDKISAFRTYFDDALPARADDRHVRQAPRITSGRLVPPRRRGRAGSGRPNVARGAACGCRDRCGRRRRGPGLRDLRPRRRRRDHRRRLRHHLGRLLELHAIWVDESLRKRGLGRALMAAAETEARRRGCALVQFLAYDLLTPGLYERLGYETVGIIKGWPAGSAARWYRKDL